MWYQFEFTLTANVSSVTDANVSRARISDRSSVGLDLVPRVRSAPPPSFEVPTVELRSSNVSHVNRNMPWPFQLASGGRRGYWLVAGADTPISVMRVAGEAFLCLDWTGDDRL